MLKKTAIVVAGLLVAGVANAQGTGGFVEGSVGFGKFDLGNTSGWTVDDKDTQWGLTAGYMFNENFGLEAGYRDLGSASGTASITGTGTLYGKALTGTATLNMSGDADGWLLGVRGNLPINDQFSVNARAGLFSWSSDVKVAFSAAGTWGGTAVAAGASASQKFSGTDPYYGIGANYNINKQLGVGVGYTAFDLDELGIKNDSWDINLQYRF